MYSHLFRSSALTCRFNPLPLLKTLRINYSWAYQYEAPPSPADSILRLFQSKLSVEFQQDSCVDRWEQFPWQQQVARVWAGEARALDVTSALDQYDLFLPVKVCEAIAVCYWSQLGQVSAFTLGDKQTHTDINKHIQRSESVPFQFTPVQFGEQDKFSSENESNSLQEKSLTRFLFSWGKEPWFGWNVWICF